MNALELRKELLFGLSPAEWWAWCYLVFLAHQQGSTQVILPRPGEDPEAEKVFGRKHLKNLLKSLKSKRHLTHIIIPKSKSQQITIFLPASKIGELQFPNMEKGCPQFPNNKGLGKPGSPKATLGNCGSPTLRIINDTWPDPTPLQAKLKEKLELLISLKQGDLKGEIQRMTREAIRQLMILMQAVKAKEPRNKGLDQAVRLYAMIRYLQEEQLIERPQAWMDTVAREAGRQWNRRGSGTADVPLISQEKGG